MTFKKFIIFMLIMIVTAYFSLFFGWRLLG